MRLAASSKFELESVPPKGFVGSMLRKVVALVVVYSCYASSLWTYAQPIGGVVRRPAGFAVPSSPRPSLDALTHLAGGVDPYAAAGGADSSHSYRPTIYTNFDELNALNHVDDDQPPSNCTVHSSSPASDDDGEGGHGDPYAQYKHHNYSYGDDDKPRGPNPPITSTGLAIFGPQTYTRTHGGPDDFTSTITLPSWASQPFFLHLVNGDGAGNHRVSSATIRLNGTTLIGESVFNQNVATVDCAIQLTTQSTLQVDLDSKPGSFLTITALGQPQDRTPPTVSIAAPANNSAINTPQAHFDVLYQDPTVSGQPAASGINLATLQVLIDGADRTSLFAKRPNEATADLPASLALTQGPHTVTASIKDNTGNIGQATAQFQVDTTAPTLAIAQPAAGSFLNNRTAQVQLTYSDNFALNLASLKATVNGTDSTALFTKTATGATATLSGLPLGGNTIVAGISDQAGNPATASIAFNVDTTPPVITIVHPAAGSIHGAASVDYLLQYSDDQAIDPNTLVVTVDGSPLAVTPGATNASGTFTLANGTGHVLTASIKDKAGNPATASSTFTVDTSVPAVHIVLPVANSALNNPTPPFQVQYNESISGVNTATFKASVDGSDVTSLFTVGSGSASATLQTPLADGTHLFAAQIASDAGNVGQASSQVLIDTIKPQLTIVSPTGAVNSATPVALAQYSDSGSGIDTTSVHMTLDGVDVTGTFAASASSATGTLGSGASLSESTHQLAVTVADKAGNVAQASSSFLVDVTPPAASFSSPVNNSFINNPQPAITLTYSDSGSGVNTNSIHLFLQQGSTAETEITSLFAFVAGQGSGTIPAASALTPGTYHLRALVVDNAGNQTTATSAFVVDTAPPTYTIVAPPANAFLNTATPTFTVTYTDDSSGVDTAKFALLVDGVDRTNRLTVTATGASGTLQASDALADGTHQISVTVLDRAGNTAPVVPQSFLVDTIRPTLTITTPAAASFTNNNHTPIAVTYSDSGSGIDVTSFQVLIDGVDHTAEFTATATWASGATTAALLDGAHNITVNIKDLAGNLTAATTPFTVDTVPPQITILQPPDGIFTNAFSITVSGTVTDIAPVTITVAGKATPVAADHTFTATVTLTSDPTQPITASATDAVGNASSATVNVKVDRVPPTITATVTPAPNAAGWNNTNVTVTFTCADDYSGVATCPSPASVITEGANQSVIGQAVDKAGNTSSPLTVKVSVDKTPPVITAAYAPPANTAGWNMTDVTVTFVCSDTLSGIVLCPPPQIVMTQGKAQPITGIVSDVAGNTASATATLNIEKTAPTITATLTPAANTAGWNNSDVTVNFQCTPSASDIVSCQSPVTVSTDGKNQQVNGTVTDQALSGIVQCPSPTTVSTEGAKQNIVAQAMDQAGNIAAVTTALSIDKTPPTITVTATPSPNGGGWNNSNVTVNFSCNDNLSGVASCPSEQLITTEGQGQNTSGQATDVAGNTATGSIVLNIDKTPPTIVQISTPDHISKLHSGQVSVTVNDNFTVAQVVISVNGTSLGTFTTPPYQTALQVPTGANPGDTLTVTVVATDQAGNSQTASRGVSVAADGVIVGQVLSDTTGLPVPGASVQVISASGQTDQTDDRGRYSFQATDAHAFVYTTDTNSTTVEREVFVQPGAGTVAVDARLTPLASKVTIGSSGGILKAGSISISVPAAFVADGTNFQLTPLSGQGLPGLLPLGWSPLTAFDLRASAATANLPATISSLPNAVMHLVTYNPSLHAWTMVAQNLQPVSGAASFTVPTTGAYALVVPDAPPAPAVPIVIPDIGAALTGITVQPIDPAVSSSGSFNPAVLPPAGGTATASLGLQSPSFTPSGTVIQANVSEKFSLASGDVVSEQTRSEDIVLYNAQAPANSSMGAQFPVTPSHKYSNTQLLTGKIHLDILAGREGVRGQPGGNDPLTLTDGFTTISVPGGALSQDTAIAIQSIPFEDFVPASSTLSALQEVLVDFSGEALNTPAQLSIPATGLDPTHNFLLTQVQRISGVPHMVAVALAQVNGSILTSVSSPGLPGVIRGGEYVFYDISAPIGFVQGAVSSTAGTVQALVQTDSLPITSVTGGDGHYILPALAGTVNLKASAPGTLLSGTATTQLTAGQTVALNIQLAGSANTAVVAPADGSLPGSAAAVRVVGFRHSADLRAGQQPRSGRPVHSASERFGRHLRRSDRRSYVHVHDQSRGYAQFRSQPDHIRLP